MTRRRRRWLDAARQSLRDRRGRSLRTRSHRLGGLRGAGDLPDQSHGHRRLQARRGTRRGNLDARDPAARAGAGQVLMRAPLRSALAPRLMLVALGAGALDTHVLARSGAAGPLRGADPRAALHAVPERIDRRFAGGPRGGPAQPGARAAARRQIRRRDPRLDGGALRGLHPVPAALLVAQCLAVGRTGRPAAAGAPSCAGASCASARSCWRRISTPSKRTCAPDAQPLSCSRPRSPLAAFWPWPCRLLRARKRPAPAPAAALAAVAVLVAGGAACCMSPGATGAGTPAPAADSPADHGRPPGPPARAGPEEPRRLADARALLPGAAGVSRWRCGRSSVPTA